MKTTRKILAPLLALALVGVTPSLLAASPPKVGQKAPLVKGVDQDGNKWKLSDALGRSVVLLYFYPKDETPGCTKEACGFRDRIAELKAQGVDVIGVSFDTADSHKHFSFKYNLNFPLIADTKGKIADAYGARKTKGRDLDRRISFLIGLDGKIVHVTESPDPEVHLAEMEKAVKSLNVKM